MGQHTGNKTAKTGTAAGGAALVVSLISLSLLESLGNNVARFLLESQGLAVFDLPRERVAHYQYYHVCHGRDPPTY